MGTDVSESRRAPRRNAVVQAFHKPGTVGLVLGNPVSKPTQDTESANAKANYGAGQACADLFIAECKGQAGRLKNFLVNIAQGDQQWRKGFRVALSLHLRQIREHVKSKEGTPEGDMWKTTARSAGVRISEAVTFSKAIDAGLTWSAVEAFPYHACIGAARDYLTGQAAGPTQRRGRKPAAFLDKLKKFLESNAKGEADLKQAAEFAETMAKLEHAKNKAAPF